MKTCSTIKSIRITCGADRDAFTIVEILVVVMLLALFAGATVTAYFGTYKRLLVEKAANDIYLAAKYARLVAVEKQKSCLLALNDETGGFALMFSQNNADGEMEGDGLIANQYSRPATFADGVLYEKIAIVPSGQPDEDTENQKKVTFYPDGTADTAVIQIGDGKNVYTVLIQAATGKAKVVRGLPDEMAMGAVDLDAVEE
ncbi:MAG: hypothetical protein FVQ79_13525 [Planctomycetes bacterium]|nr:hypothetical protein [Planctomycetota bacterium]